MKFDKNKVHFVGIGGIGMSGLAKVLLTRKIQVSGSDICASSITQELTKMGAAVAIGHRSNNVPQDAELVICSAAIKPDNVELLEARRRGLPVLKYAQLLGKLMEDYAGIAVSGTHGKSTTTAMIAYIMQQAGYSPSFVIGARVPQLDASSGAGVGNYLVVEACEYDRSFHNLTPTVAVINNIEEDHLDYYRDLGEIARSFKDFAARVKAGGVLVANVDDPRVKEIASQASSRVITVGRHNPAHWQAHSLASERGCYSFKARLDGEELGIFRLRIPGVHHVSNALAAIASCYWTGVSLERARRALQEFQGVERRFQLLGEAAGVAIMDDYAHHPTEIRCTLQAAREFFPGRRLWCVFQPHQHSRTRFLLADFARSFTHADEILLPDIYFVRDSAKEKMLISSRDLVTKLEARGCRARYLPSFDDIRECLSEELQPGDVLVTMGAGDIWKVAHGMLQRLKGNHEVPGEPEGAHLNGGGRTCEGACLSAQSG